MGQITESNRLNQTGRIKQAVCAVDAVRAETEPGRDLRQLIHSDAHLHTSSCIGYLEVAFVRWRTAVAGKKMLFGGKTRLESKSSEPPLVSSMAKILLVYSKSNRSCQTTGAN